MLPNSQDLTEAFSRFSQASQQLEVAYAALQTKVEGLTHELALANGELKRQYTEKEALSHRLEALLAALPAGVVVVDGQGQVIDFNPAAQQLLTHLVHGETWVSLATAVLQPTHTPHEWEVQLSDGSMRRLMIEHSPLGGLDTIVLLHDITAAFTLQTQLEHHQRLSAMGEMAASLAHQLRTPLATALLYTAHLGKSELADNERRRFADKSLNRLRHMEHLIQQMLLFVRGQQQATQEWIPLEALLNEAAQVLEPQRQWAAVTWQFEVKIATHVQIWGERKMLLSALVNILENALQHTPAHGQVNLQALVTQAGYVEISICNEGEPIPAAIQAKIFEPFFTTRAEGNGLGLAIAQNVFRTHHGQLTLAYSHATRGTCFLIQLPLLGS